MYPTGTIHTMRDIVLKTDGIKVNNSETFLVTQLTKLSTYMSDVIATLTNKKRVHIESNILVFILRQTVGFIRNLSRIKWLKFCQIITHYQSLLETHFDEGTCDLQRASYKTTVNINVR